MFKASRCGIKMSTTVSPQVTRRSVRGVSAPLFYVNRNDTILVFTTCCHLETVSSFDTGGDPSLCDILKPGDVIFTVSYCGTLVKILLANTDKRFDCASAYLHSVYDGMENVVIASTKVSKECLECTNST